MTLFKNLQQSFVTNFATSFAKHFETFRFYLCYIDSADFISRQEYGYSLRNPQFPVVDFLNTLSLEELGVLAFIKLLGAQTDDVYAGFLLSLANGQNCFGIGHGNSQADYIRAIMNTSQAPGDGYTFTLGLERLGIVLDDARASADYLAA